MLQGQLIARSTFEGNLLGTGKKGRQNAYGSWKIGKSSSTCTHMMYKNTYLDLCVVDQVESLCSLCLFIFPSVLHIIHNVPACSKHFCIQVPTFKSSFSKRPKPRWGCTLHKFRPFFKKNKVLSGCIRPEGENLPESSRHLRNQQTKRRITWILWLVVFPWSNGNSPSSWLADGFHLWKNSKLRRKFGSQAYQKWSILLFQRDGLRHLTATPFWRFSCFLIPKKYSHGITQSNIICAKRAPPSPGSALVLNL